MIKNIRTRLLRLGKWGSCLLLANAAQAATFSTDFNSGLPPGTAVYGNAVVDATGGVSDSGVLKLTTAIASQSGSFVLIDDLDDGAKVSSFTATFKARVGGGTGADGFSFNFANDLPNIAFAETGAGTGLTIIFDTYNNDANEISPGVRIRFNNVDVAGKKFSGLRTGTNFVDVTISAHANGTLDVIYNGTAVFTNLFVYQPIAGRFGFGSRTGGSTDNHFIDDLNITTTQLGYPYAKSVSPLGTGIRPDPTVLIKLQDNGAQAVDPATVALNLNGTPIPAVDFTVTQDTGITTVTYRPGILPAGSTNIYAITFATTAAPENSQTFSYSFVVGPYQALPASFAAPDGTIDLNSIGFGVKVSQIAVDRGATLERAELQLANQLIDPATSQPYPNLANLSSADTNGVIYDLDFINYNKDGAAGSTGFFTPDRSMPGIPGTTGSSDNVALEVVAYLALNPGAYTFGITADDGFRLTAGRNPRDAFATELASVDGLHTNTVETVFSFTVSQAGIYPFRLLYFQNQGPANLEWYSITPSGQKIQIDDTSTADGIVSYATATVTRPYVRSVSPKPGAVGVALSANVDLTLVDGTIQVDGPSIQLYFNGSNVTAGVTRQFANGVTSLSYNPPGNLPQQTTNVVQLVYGDTAANMTTNVFSFVTARVLQQLWSIAPGARTYVTTGSTERGLGYNPITGHVLLVSRVNGTTIRGIYILDGETGAEVGQLSTNGISGGNLFSLNMIDVADDGAIYAANLTGGGTPANNAFKIYRWASETATPTIAFNGDAGVGVSNRFGDDFRVRGAGTNTQILAGGNTPATNAAFFTTLNGVNFTAQRLNITGIAGGDIRLGLAFGAGNTFYGIQTGKPLRYIGFDPVSGSASNISSYNLITAFAPPTTSINIGPIGIDLVNGRLIGNGTSQNAGTNHGMAIYELPNLSTSGNNSPVDTKIFPTTNLNFGTGAIDFNADGSRVFTLDTNNGLLAFSLSVRPTIYVSRTGGQATVTWTGSSVLQSATNPAGPYSTLVGATSPYSVNPAGGAAQFFRLKD